MDFSSNRESGLLEAIGREFSSNRDLNVLLNNVFSIIVSYYHIERGMISIYHRDEEVISVNIHYGYTAEEIEHGVYNPGEDIMGTGAPLVIPDIRNDLRFLSRMEANRNIYNNRISFIYIPVIIEKSVIGSITIDILNNSGRDLVEECNMLTTISIMIAQAVSSRMEMISMEKRLRSENEELRRMCEEGALPEKIIGKYGERRDLRQNGLLVSVTGPTVRAGGSGSLEERTEQFEREIIIESLKESKGNISRAAKSLGTTKRILGYKMSRLGIDYRLFRGQ